LPFIVHYLPSTLSDYNIVQYANNGTTPKITISPIATISPLFVIYCNFPRGGGGRSIPMSDPTDKYLWKSRS